MASNIQMFSEQLQQHFGDKLLSNVVAVGEVTIEVSSENLLEVCQALKSQFKFEQLIDLCGVDYSEYKNSEWSTDSSSSQGFSRGVDSHSSGRMRFGDEPGYINHDRKRFAVVTHLLSVANNQRLRVRSFCENDDVPVMPSVIDIWNSVNWYEREAFDLYGIVFDGHPDLRRILTDYGFVGHPFRKDFPLVGHVEMTYDEEQKRVVYQPVSIDPRVLVPRVIREDHRYDHESQESDNA